MSTIRQLAWVLAFAPAVTWAQPQTKMPSGIPEKERQVYAVDAGGRAITALETGSSLHIGLHGLRPRTTYEIRLSFDRPALDSH